MSYMPIENLPVSIKTMVIKREGMTIYYPQIIRMENVAVQKKMNQTILQLAQYLIKQQHIQQDVEDFIEVIEIARASCRETVYHSLVPVHLKTPTAPPTLIHPT